MIETKQVQTMDTESQAIEKHIFDLKRPAFWDKSLILFLCGCFLGSIPFILNILFSNGELSDLNFTRIGVILIPCLILTILVRIFIRPQTGSQIEFEQEQLVLPPRFKFLRSVKVPFSEINLVVVRGKGRKKQLVIDSQKKLYAFHLQDFVKLKDLEYFVKILANHIKLLPNGESQWESIQERISIFNKIKLKKGFVVWILCTILLLMYFTELNMGVGQNKIVLLNLGANVPYLVQAGQWYRLFVCTFLHLNFIHLMFNVAALAVLGLMLEQLMGVERFLIVYLVSALGGAIASMLTAPSLLSVGASTGIYGLIGALAILNIRFSTQLPAGYRIPSMNWIFFICLSFMLPVLIPQIDIAAHLGGFVTGSGITFLLYRGWKKYDVNLKPDRWVLVTAFIIAVLFAYEGLISINYIHEGNDRDIIRVARVYGQDKTANPEILNDLAWAIVTRKTADTENLYLALEMAEKAVMMGKQKHAYLDTLATIYYRLGLIEKAIITEMRAIELNGNKYYASQLAFFLSSKSLSEHPVLKKNVSASTVRFRIEWIVDDAKGDYIITAELKKKFVEGLIAFLKVSHNGRDIGVIRFTPCDSKKMIYQYKSMEDDNIDKLPYGSKLHILLIDYSEKYLKARNKTWVYWPMDPRVATLHKNII